MAEGKYTFGLEKNVACALTYVMGWVTGLVFFLVEKENKDIRFHAAQSIVTFGILTVLSMIPVIGWILSPFIFLVSLILWIVLLVKAYKGERFKLVVVGGFAEKLAGK